MVPLSIVIMAIHLNFFYNLLFLLNSDFNDFTQKMIGKNLQIVYKVTHNPMNGVCQRWPEISSIAGNDNARVKQTVLYFKHVAIFRNRTWKQKPIELLKRVLIMTYSSSDWLINWWVLFSASKVMYYSLSHNYCEHHCFMISQKPFHVWSFLFQGELPMPNSVTSAKITLICSLSSEISMFEDFFQVTRWPDFAV